LAPQRRQGPRQIWALGGPVRHSRLLPVAMTLLALGVVLGCAKPPQDNAANASAGQSFATPDEAVAALISAAESHDIDALRRVLGPGTDKLLASGDPIADRKEIDSFLGRYKTYHELVEGTPNNLVLLVGEDRWPSPIPLVRTSGLWSFDGPAGAEELVLRRIGANELRTIEVMRGFVEAETEYGAAAHDGGATGEYAQKLRSQPGKHDGLYWEVAPGEPESPAGPLLAAAAEEGYAGTQPARTPYHGYLYRMLTSQGPAATGGPRDYLAAGKLTGGFALLAYPDSYAASGIMTFIVNQDGVVWQRDLGADTARTAKSIQQFNPDNSWTPIAPEG
jgi:Protein of unknown function (DUF2950)